MTLPGMTRQQSLTACLALCLLGFGVTAVAGCPGFEPDFLSNYDGDIDGKHRIRMTLTSSNEQVSGVYFYAKHLEDIRVRARAVDATHIVLEELDSQGAVTAIFTGEFVQKDPKSYYRGGDLQCEVILGSWRKVTSERALPFYLSLADITGGTLDHRYALVGTQDDAVVHRNARRFVEAVKAIDKATVAGLVVYPIKVSLNSRNVTIASPEEFVAHYDSIITPERRAAISRALPRNMFVRYNGIRLGESGVWLNEEGKALSL